jgi:gas vesicle protein
MKQSHVYAFLGGALIGGIIALLLAPDKGSETRKKLSKKLEEGSDFTKEQIELLLNYLKKKVAEGISGLDDEIADLEKQLENIEENIGNEE